MDRKDIDAKLAESDTWVREAYRSLSAICEQHALQVTVESGPGMRFGLGRGRWFCRLHPKLGHIAVGFPNTMRGELDRLGLLRPQKEAAWLNMDQQTPRQTVIDLLERSAARVAQADAAGASPRRRPGALGQRNAQPDPAALDVAVEALASWPFEGWERVRPGFPQVQGVLDVQNAIADLPVCTVLFGLFEFACRELDLAQGPPLAWPQGATRLRGVGQQSPTPQRPCRPARTRHA